MSSSTNSRPTNTGDTAVWLHNKLGTSNDTALWADNTSIISQLNPEVLRNIKSCFHDLQVNVKLKLLLTFLHISRRNLDEWKKELDGIIAQALKDSDAWVSVLAEMLRTFPGSGMINFEFKTNPNQTFLEFFNEIKKLIKKNETKKGFTGVLPLEVVFLDRRVFEASYGPTRSPVKHFNLKHETKAVTQRSEYLQKACEASQNKKTSASLMVQRRHRTDSAPLRGIPRNSIFTPTHNRTFGRSIGSSGGSLGNTSRLFSGANIGGKRDGGIVLLDVNELPATNRETLKKRKKEEKEEKEKEKEKEREEKEKEKEREKAAKLAPVTPTTPTTPVFGHKTSNDVNETIAASNISPAKSNVAANFNNTTTTGQLELPGSLSRVLQQTSIGAAFQRGQTLPSAADSLEQQQPTASVIKNSANRTTIMASKSTPAQVADKWPPTTPTAAAAAQPPPSVINKGPPNFATAGQQQPFSILRQTIAATAKNRPEQTIVGRPMGPRGQQSTQPNRFMVYNTPPPGSQQAQNQMIMGPGQMQTHIQQQQSGLVYVPPMQQQQRQNAAFGLPQQQQQQQQQRPPQMSQQPQPQRLPSQPQNGQMLQQRLQSPVLRGPMGQTVPLPQNVTQIVQAIFQTSPCLSRPEKALILAFISGQRDNPCPQLGPASTIKLNEMIEERQHSNGQKVKMLIEVHFKMNYQTGHWTKMEKMRPADDRIIEQFNNRSIQEGVNTIRVHKVDQDANVTYTREIPFELPQHPQQYMQQQQQPMEHQQQQQQQQQALPMPPGGHRPPGARQIFVAPTMDQNGQMQMRLLMPQPGGGPPRNPGPGSYGGVFS